MEPEIEPDPQLAKTRGRPRGSRSEPRLKPHVDIGQRREGSSVGNRDKILVTPAANDIPLSTSTPSSSGTKPRNIYLLKHTLEKLGNSKLPKNISVLRKFLYELDNSGKVKHAAQKTTENIRAVWTFHFGSKLIMGKVGEDEPKKLVVTTQKIESKALELYNEWKGLENSSKRKDRCEKESFQMKERKFLDKLDLPMDISKKDSEGVLKRAKIIEWEEDLMHLRQQLQREQRGCAMGYDLRQESREKAKQKREEQADERKEREQSKDRHRLMDVEMGSESSETDCDSSDDVKHILERGKRKRDIMTVVSPTADRLGLSMRKRAMMAAIVVRASGHKVEDTNISPTTAWRTAQTTRVKHAEKIKTQYEVPTFVLVHWDGKNLKLRKRQTSERCCVYISGAPGDEKLLGVPEIPSGTGAAQELAVRTLLEDWHVNEQVLGIVFDTTASNTGKWRGACSFIEEYLGRAILWIACRHHVYELHVKHVASCITGETKDPGVKMFRKLQAGWSALEDDIDYTKLVKFSWTESDPWLCQIAGSVLAWSRQMLETQTFPRSDYKELVTLVAVWLGHSVENFKFMQPGPDHHARWMSKAIYAMKLSLLETQFMLTPEEQTSIRRLASFVGLFYAKGFLEASLNTSAPRNDLKFMCDVSLYGEYDQPVSDACMDSCRRHVWYLTPQLVVLALADDGLPPNERESIAKKLFETHRTGQFLPGKPVFPTVNCDSDELEDYITGDSWMIFDLIGLTEEQEWMLKPADLWGNFTDFIKFSEVIKSLRVVNDLAERGIKLILDFIHMSHDEDQRQALLQVVEDHRKTFKDFNKNTLAQL